MTDEHLNLQIAPRTSKIFGTMKMGANNSDKKLISVLQHNGLDEHEIQREAGVHYTVIRSFMRLNDPKFIATDAPPTADTQHLHDEILALRSRLATQSTETEPVTEIGDNDARLEPQQTKTKTKAKATK